MNHPAHSGFQATSKEPQRHPFWLLLFSFLLLLLLAGTEKSEAAETRRFWLFDEFIHSATFELQRGTVSLWLASSREPVSERSGLIHFDGVLDQEVSDVISRLISRHRIRHLSLNSPGGLVEPTLHLARLVRSSKVATVVERGQECYSACALLFLAGTDRILGELVKELMPDGELVTYANSSPGLLGFHAPYVLTASGAAVHLQDVKSSRVCKYLAEVLPKQSASELCDYTLATKGNAVFTYEFGSKLGVFTHRESEAVRAAAENILDSSTIFDRGWIACRWNADHLRASTLSKDEAKALTWPCSSTGVFASAPRDPSVRDRLTRAAKLRGWRPLAPDLLKFALEDAATKLQLIGLNDADNEAISCRRALLFLQSLPVGTSGPNRSDDQRAAWEKVCTGRKMDISDRAQAGVGVVQAGAIQSVLDHIATQLGPHWSPSMFRE